MNLLLQSGFISCVKDYIADPAAMSERKLRNLYEDFAEKLENTVSAPSVPYDALRTIKFALLELNLAREEMPGGDTPLAKYVKRAVAFLETELDVLLLLIENPGIAVAGKLADAVSPLKWSDKFTLTDLLELICALAESGAICKRDGTRASFKLIVICFEKLFNVELKEVRTMKSKMLDRKNKIGAFLEFLKEVYVKLTQR